MWAMNEFQNRGSKGVRAKGKKNGVKSIYLRPRRGEKRGKGSELRLAFAEPE